VGSIDLVSNDEADANVLVEASAASWVDQNKTINEKVAEILAGNKVDAILCVAGGWAGGNAASNGNISLIVVLWVMLDSKIYHNFTFGHRFLRCRITLNC